MTSSRSTGLTTNDAPASITAIAVAAVENRAGADEHVTGTEVASSAMTSTARGTVIVISIARTPPAQKREGHVAHRGGIGKPHDRDDAARLHVAQHFEHEAGDELVTTAPVDR